MMPTWYVHVIGCVVALAWGCGTNSVELHDEDTPCEHWDTISKATGCAGPSDCEISAGCDELATRYLECVADDLSQCLCESDDESLNCEGAVKPSEGSARCIAEYEAYEQCEGD